MPAPELLNFVLCDLHHIRLAEPPGKNRRTSRIIPNGRGVPPGPRPLTATRGNAAVAPTDRGTPMGTTAERRAGHSRRHGPVEGGGGRARAGRGGRAASPRTRSSRGCDPYSVGRPGVDGVLRLPADGHAGRVQGPGDQAAGRGAGARLPVGRLLVHRQGDPRRPPRRARHPDRPTAGCSPTTRCRTWPE